MTLRNAFDDLSLEGTLRKILRAVTFAKDTGDRLRVSVDNTVAIANPIVSTYWGSANTIPAYYSTGAPSSMDAREVQREQSVASFNAVRTGRWSIT